MTNPVNDGGIALDDTVVENFDVIDFSTRDTCETQRRIAAHNSVVASLKKGRPVTYCAPCDCPELYGMRSRKIVKRSVPPIEKK